MYLESITIRKSPIILLFRMVATTILVYTAFAIYSFFLHQEANDTLSFFIINKFLFIFLSVAIEAIAMVFLLLHWSFFRYKISDTEVVEKSGLIRRRVHAHSLKNTQSINITQGYLGRLLNYGNIILHNPLSKEDILLKDIPDINRYSKILRGILDGHISHPEKIIPTSH